MNALPIDIVRHILTYRGSDAFDALHYELLNPKKNTKKWREDINKRIIDGIVKTKLLSEAEYQILLKLWMKIDKQQNPEKWKRGF